MKLVKNVIISATMMVSVQAFAGGTQIGSGTGEIKCRVDISGFQMGAPFIDVLVSEKNGKISAIVNGTVGNQDIKIEEYKISPAALAAKDDSFDEDTKNLNYGELRIAQMNSYLHGELASAISFTIPLDKVKRVRLFDLDGESKTNAFGGVVLVEAFDQNDQMLGRFVSSMLPGECNPSH
jgi:hypothetical protein